jgi:hypothetical protein
MNSKTAVAYNIMRGTCTSMKCMLGGVQTLTLWPAVHQVRWMGRHAWISGNDSFRVDPPSSEFEGMRCSAIRTAEFYKGTWANSTKGPAHYTS